jgi:lysozyme
MEVSQRVSQHGIDLLIELEDVRSHLYRDIKHLASIGIGHLLTKSELCSGKIAITDPATGQREVIRYANGLTPRQMHLLLEQDLEPVVQTIQLHVHVPLTQHQFDALCCFCYNIGCEAFLGSSLLKMLNQGYYAAVPYQMSRWVHAGGEVVAGLINRRHQEIALWNLPPEEAQRTNGGLEVTSEAGPEGEGVQPPLHT